MSFFPSFVLGIFFFFFSTISPFGQFDSNSTVSEEELYRMLFGENNWESKDEPVPEAVGWFPSYSGEIGVGYSDNPLYGPYIQNDSSYLESSLEGFFMRQVDPQQFTYFYFYGEGKVFEELPEIQSTSILLGQFDHAYTPGGSTSTYGFRLRHVYYNQGFDFSELGLPYSMKMTSNKSEVIPYLSLELLEDLTSSIEIHAGKEDFAEVTEDNRDYKISFLLKGSSGSIDWQINATGQEKNTKIERCATKTAARCPTNQCRREKKVHP